MTSDVTLSVGLVMAGAAGAGAWALSVAPPTSMAQLRSLIDATPASKADAPAYPIRLELPQTRQLAAGAAASAHVDGLKASADAVLEPVTLTKDERDQTGETPTAMRSRSGLLDMDFDIATFGKVAPASGGRTIHASKSLNHGGKRVGSIDLALGLGSVVSVDRQALQALVGDGDEKVAAALAGMEGEMVSFDALRDRGVRIRYDPLADAVVIDGGA